MRKTIIIMTAILVFVVLYSRIQSSASYKRQVEYFENTTVTMERVTENYLAGEQRICDVWARYIDNKGMTAEEAAEYIRSSHVLTNTSAHISPAILLRVIPISALEQKWVFPQTGMYPGLYPALCHGRLDIACARTRKRLNREERKLDAHRRCFRRTCEPVPLGSFPYSFNNMYAAFGDIPESQILSPEEFGLTDDAVTQFRQAVFAVATGEMSIDDAIAGYGSFGK